MHTLLSNIKTLTSSSITNKRVLLRVDFNVTLTPQRHISDDARITQALPTIKKLLEGHNKLILVSHLDRPQGRDPKLSLSVVADRLQTFLPDHKVVLIDDFLSTEGKAQLKNQKENEVYMLENIRFYEGEQTNDPKFAKELAKLADDFVNDAFGVSHRNDATVVSLPHFLPSYAGLLMEKEVAAIAKILETPKKPIVAIIGGAKTSTKMAFLSKLIDITDSLILGGGIANTFLLAKGFELGQSLVEKDQVDNAKKLMEHAQKKGTEILLPTDAVGKLNGETVNTVYPMNSIPNDFKVLDIGPDTQAKYAAVIAKANTVVWNGPVGYCEEEPFSRGTDFLFYSITHNDHLFSLVGGGDTLAAISKKEYLEKISHISTGGGAMLEFIENGTLPGLEALRQRSG